MAAALIAVLAIPWFLHAAVVLLSTLGVTPLAGRPWALAMLFGALVLALALATKTQQHAIDARSVVDETLARSSRWIAQALSIAGAIAFAVALVLSVLLPVVAYDALAYRLPVIAQWLDVGRIAWVVSDDAVRNGYPMGQEAVSAVIAAAAGSLRWASATSFFYVASGALALWLLCETCGVRRVLARAAAGLFVLVPMMILNAPSGYVDAAFAGATVALFCTATLLAGAKRPDLWLSAATGMAAADVLALKGTGVVFVALVSAALGARFWLQRAAKPRACSWSCVGLAVLCAAPGTFWALRNVAHTGNPLWPVAIEFAGHSLLPGIGTMDQILDTAHNTPAAFASLGSAERVLRTWLQLSGPAVDFDDRMTGLGWAWPLLGLPAIAACAWTLLAEREARDSRRLRDLGFVLLLTAACFALQPLKWWPRYTLWIWGAGAIAIAVQAERLAHMGRSRLLSFYLLCAMLLCVGEGTFALTHAKEAKTAVARWLRLQSTISSALADPRQALNATTWVSPKFWELGIDREHHVCRGAWKPKTDNANLDGVFAQLDPRPQVHVLTDDDGNWPRLREAWRSSLCGRLLLLEGSPVLPFAAQDPSVVVERAVAFDPLFIVRPRTAVALGHLEDSQP